MPSPLIRKLATMEGVATVDAADIDDHLDAIAASGRQAILFFTGDPAQRPEANDVAVVLPEILAAFGGHLSCLIVARGSEDALKARFHVVLMPSLAVIRGRRPVGVLGRIRDWSEYIDRINVWLQPEAPFLVASGGPKVEITFAGREIGA